MKNHLKPVILVKTARRARQGRLPEGPRRRGPEGSQGGRNAALPSWNPAAPTPLTHIQGEAVTPLILSSLLRSGLARVERLEKQHLGRWIENLGTGLGTRVLAH